MAVQPQHEDLARVLSSVWEHIKYDIAQLFEDEGDRHGFDKQTAVDVASTCVDYVGMHAGTKEQQDRLVALDEAEFEALARETFKEFK